MNLRSFLFILGLSLPLTLGIESQAKLSGAHRLWQTVSMHFQNWIEPKTRRLRVQRRVHPGLDIPGFAVRETGWMRARALLLMSGKSENVGVFSEHLDELDEVIRLLERNHEGYLGGAKVDFSKSGFLNRFREWEFLNHVPKGLREMVIQDLEIQIGTHITEIAKFVARNSQNRKLTVAERNTMIRLFVGRLVEWSDHSQTGDRFAGEALQLLDQAAARELEDGLPEVLWKQLYLVAQYRPASDLDPPMDRVPHLREWLERRYGGARLRQRLSSSERPESSITLDELAEELDRVLIYEISAQKGWLLPSRGIQDRELTDAILMIRKLFTVPEPDGRLFFRVLGEVEDLNPGITIRRQGSDHPSEVTRVLADALSMPAMHLAETMKTAERNPMTALYELLEVDRMDIAEPILKVMRVGMEPEEMLGVIRAYDRGSLEMTVSERLNRLNLFVHELESMTTYFQDYRGGAVTINRGIGELVMEIFDETGLLGELSMRALNERGLGADDLVEEFLKGYQSDLFVLKSKVSDVLEEYVRARRSSGE